MQGRQLHDYYVVAANLQFNPNTTNRLLAPGQSRTFTASAAVPSGVTLTGVEARLVAMVFDDNTSFGDEGVVEEVFAARVADRDTYAELLSEVRSVFRKMSTKADQVQA